MNRNPEETIRIHEAGHCVGRVLGAQALGWPTDELFGDAVILPTPMGIGEIQDPTPNQWEELASCIPEMHATAIDVDAWFTTKVIELILGPMAEAKFLGKSFDDVFGDYGSEDDFDDIVRLGDLCGKTQREIAEAIVENIGIAERLIEHPKVWRAVQSAAESFTYGRNDGRKTTKIILDAL
jgi:hypothetical protein